MALILDGTNGLSDVDGTAGTPAIRGSDANTGIFFPAADTIAFAEGGVEVMRIDSSGNLNLATSGSALQWSNASNNCYIAASSGNLQFATGTSGYVERMRIDSSGNLLVGTTTRYTTGGWTPRLTLAPGNDGIAVPNIPSGGYAALITAPAGSNTYFAGYFLGPSGNIGSISCSTTNTTYNTSSDYRLKHDIQPMTGALAKVAALKPVTYKWNADDSNGEGFIAHELQEVCPDAVTGVKDAVDAEGNPQYQGIDTSFLVATLTAAIQELKAINDAQAQTIESLTARVVALEGQAT